ncbi:PFL_4669 family integrating conjugative element protein [Xenorhabdus koppenhoeferi]|uniref:Integrating conjugative element protein, PFL_4669 family n=1 Tax=Xenorhabdus koppenhoeferi TaxID=351659 RepID=A0A1I7H5A5_9GAMM|nr:TIGR03761 family integrating conjugative element protein [Xenorhabdus koppenhoeferi]CEE94253.1 Integrating conjugative element protein, PFL_4669 family [Xenorhabdus nematophila str. Anatoliense]SFU55850.1 integrating conjugative element protein, PFL_4669 family [Xenorhabdus koppenhoeferi]
MIDTNKETTANKKSAGALKSTFTLALHTNYAIKLWEGRKNNDGKKKSKWSIIGIPVFIKMASRIHGDSLQNNPFADMILWRLEKSLNESSKIIENELDKAGKWLANLPNQIHVSDVMSESPLNLEIFSRTPLGYRCVWLLVGFDQLAMKTLQAYHYGLISSKKRDEVLSGSGHRVRQAFGVVTLYRSFPISRIGLDVESEEYKAAVKIMGDLDHGILKGSRRSSFSPPLAALK